MPHRFDVHVYLNPFCWAIFTPLMYQTLPNEIVKKKNKKRKRNHQVKTTRQKKMRWRLAVKIHFELNWNRRFVSTYKTESDDLFFFLLLFPMECQKLPEWIWTIRGSVVVTKSNHQLKKEFMKTNKNTLKLFFTTLSN